MKTNGRQNRRWRAFTLLELAVVLAITAVIAALTLPQLQRVNDDAAAKTDAYNFIAMVRHASELARSTRSLICVIADFNAPHFRLATPGGSYGQCDTGNPAANTTVQTYTFPTYAPGSLLVEHIVPPDPTVPVTAAPSGAVVWALSEFGEPSGVEGSYFENTFGLAAVSNGRRKPYFTARATFGGTVTVTVTQYISGTIEVSGL